MPSSIYDLLETREVSLEQAEVLDLARDIASGLAYIHGQRYVAHPWTIPTHLRDALQAVPFFLLSRHLVSGCCWLFFWRW